jgi:DNA-binding NarL/FixJ family response regulator
MTISETQKEVLINASQRANGSIYPLPTRLKGASINKVLNALYNKGLIDKVEDKIVITDAGEIALYGEGGKPSKPARKGTKKAVLLEMLGQGATINEIADATGWQKHTIRGTMSNLKKQIGIEIITTKTDGEDRVYKIG